jgi:hypothetical protein
MAAVLEFLVAEMVEIAGMTCKESGKKRITTRHFELAIR